MVKNCKKKIEIKHRIYLNVLLALIKSQSPLKHLKIFKRQKKQILLQPNLVKSQKLRLYSSAPEKIN